LYQFDREYNAGFQASFNVSVGIVNFDLSALMEFRLLPQMTFPRPSEAWLALNYLHLAQMQAAGIQAAGVITIGYDRGLGLKGGCSS